MITHKAGVCLGAMNGEEVLVVDVRSSSSASSESGSSSSGEDSSSSSSVDSTSRVSSLWKEDELGNHLLVTCAENEAKFYKDRFARGSIGRCVWFKGHWITPNEFQAVSGRQSSKDWKRSIRMNGRCLKEYICEGLFKEHLKVCTCNICQGEDEELRKQEGVLALAAKRRRLSQAGVESSHSSHTSQQGMSDNDVGVALGVESGESDGQLHDVLKRKLSNSKSKRKKRGRPPKNQRVWSPSGEVAQEGSSNEEDEYRPSKIPHMILETNEADVVIDPSDYLPRRSGRAGKPSGYRTELGTYTNKPIDWDVEEVGEFLKLQGFAAYVDSFQEYDINGQSLFLLREHHLLERFNMKLGPTLRLLDTISRLQHPPVVF